MNTQSVRAAMTKLSVTGLAVAALLIASPINTKANDSKDKIATVSKSQVSVKYAGASDNSVVFKVQFHNPTAQKFSFLIKNEAGDILFSGQYNDANFSKTIHLLKENEDMNPVFIIRTGNQTIENSFSITSSTEVVEDVVVTRL